MLGFCDSQKQVREFGAGETSCRHARALQKLACPIVGRQWRKGLVSARAVGGYGYECKPDKTWLRVAQGGGVGEGKPNIVLHRSRANQGDGFFQNYRRAPVTTALGGYRLHGCAER